MAVVNSGGPAPEGAASERAASPSASSARLRESNCRGNSGWSAGARLPGSARERSGSESEGAPDFQLARERSTFAPVARLR
jgi:hypothetical protein